MVIDDKTALTGSGVDRQFPIVSANHAPHHLQQLREWFVAEWGHIDPFEGVHAGFPVPVPLLAMNEAELVGGLAFTSAPLPGSTDIGVWVNALLVLPEYRGMGMASQLVRAAEAVAARSGATTLYVYTSIPALYQKLGWQLVNSSGESKVLARQCHRSHGSSDSDAIF